MLINTCIWNVFCAGASPVFLRNRFNSLGSLMKLLLNTAVVGLIRLTGTHPSLVRLYYKQWVTMPRPILYSSEISPPCRAVLLTAEAIGLDLEIREINLSTREQFNEDFQKINPQHTIPALDDNGDTIWDSHAIICYLVGKYGKNDALYPKDLKRRALIDQRLHFDSGILFAQLRGIVKPILRAGVKTIPGEKRELVEEAYGFLNKFLESKKWLAGDSYTLADISCVTTLSSLEAVVPIFPYPNVVRWLKICENELPGYAKLNAPGNKLLHETVKSKLQ